VWSHHIGRFGIERYERSEKTFDDKRKAFDQLFTCALAGGPISLPLRFSRGQDSHSTFVAVVKGPSGAWSGYLSDCLLYELNDEGEVVSLATLPRVVDGSMSCTQSDGIIWKCQNDTFIKVIPVRQGPAMSMGGGGPDGVANVAWTRRVQYREPEAWFFTGKAGDPVAFGNSFAFCLPAGGYVSKKGDKTYQFPIAAVDLTTGVESSLLLKVPFDGEFVIPKTNVAMERSADGREVYRMGSFHLLAITKLAAEGDKLEITIATENRPYGLRFDLGKVVEGKSDAKVSMDPLQEARARVQLVDPKDLNETLQAAAHGADVEFLKAVLEAGADPKYSSEVGWTALMVAAAYGSASVLDTLIAAGSDVNAADRNCGGQTILMWAARSGREAKRKITSLLKAGANPKGNSNGGYNALHSAASAGDLEAVEYLLQAGLRASDRDLDGGTPLIAASSSGKANVTKALIQAGADVNAKDNEGMTALMRAAENVSAAAIVEVLLKAGANPNDKDRAGRTALQIAKTSNYFGAAEVVALLKPVTAEK
jgi:ankyrin repeat protein